MFSNRTQWKLTRNGWTAALDKVRASGAPILDLTLSNPTRAGLQFDNSAILQSLASPHAMDYDPQPKGLLTARKAVCDYYSVAVGIGDIDPDQIILTTSTSEGYSFAFRLLCNPGDELLVPKPSYPLFEFLADLHDIKLVPYPLLYDHGWQMDFHSLEQAVTHRTRGVVVVHPNNPTGSYVSAAERRQLNEFCKEHSLAVIADEVFLDYRLDATTGESLGLAEFARCGAPGLTSPFSFSSNDEVLTFTLSGISKISALPQMKLAWLITSGPERLVKEASARLEIIADTFLSMSTPVQLALPVLLAQREGVQRQLMDRVRANLAELDRQLSHQTLCQRLEVQGGWYAVLRAPVTQTDEELTVRLLQEKQVLAHPGHFYDFPGEGYLVLSLITPEGEFAEGLRQVLQLLIVDC